MLVGLFTSAVMYNVRVGQIHISYVQPARGINTDPAVWPDGARPLSTFSKIITV